jgi:hypothetical protein
MATLEELAKSAASGNAMELRGLVQDWLGSRPQLAQTPPPITKDPRVVAIAAALAELFAERLHQHPPAWAAHVGPLQEPLFLLKSAGTMKRLRDLCETESPHPLRRRRLYAPPNYLEFV